MDVTWQSCGRNTVDRETKRYWFDKLINYSLEDVSNAFDKWLLTQDKLPVVKDILSLCQHKVTISPRLEKSSLSREENKAQAAKVTKFIAQNVKPARRGLAWAEKVKSNPKNYPAITLKLANEALGMEVEA